MTSRDKYKTSGIKDRVLRRLFVPKEGKWQAEEENYAVKSMYCSLHIITATKSRRVRWAEYVARMWEIRYVYQIFVGKPELKISHCKTHVDEDPANNPYSESYWQDVVNTVATVQVLWQRPIFCRSSETIGYSRGILNYEVKSIAFRALEVMHYIDVGLRLLSIGICLHSNTRVLTDNCGLVAEENKKK
jgi:hypothetical protein